MARDYCAEMFWFDCSTPEAIEATYDGIDVFNADALAGNASAIKVWRQWLTEHKGAYALHRVNTLADYSGYFEAYMRACRQPPDA